MRGASGRQAAGAILLEVMLAVTVFVVSGLAIVGSLRQAMGRMEEQRLRLQAADLARSAMARIEAGIAAPESMTGPAVRWSPEWLLDAERAAPGPEMDPGLPGVSLEASLMPASGEDGADGWDGVGWQLEVESEPSAYEGLSLVSVRAFLPGADPERARASFTLRQLVRLSPGAERPLGREDELTNELRRRPGAGGPGRPGGAGGAS